MRRGHYPSSAFARPVAWLHCVLAGAAIASLAVAAHAADLGEAPMRQESQDRTGWKPMPKAGLTRATVIGLYQNAYLPGNSVATGWTGSIAGCVRGTTSNAHQQATIDRVNYYRALVGLPALSLLTGTPTTQNQAAALMFAANSSLSHTPPPSWLCYTTEGAAGAGSSNIALGAAGPVAIDLYIDDSGSSNTAAGHRRWILYPPRASMATGDTDAASAPDSNALYVFGPTTTRPATPNGIAWPPAGFVPYQNLPSSSNRWSFSYPSADFTNAVVTMSGPSGSIAVSKEALATGYGDNTLVFKPSGVSYAKPASDTSYAVQISGIGGSGVPTTFSYTVTVIDPAGPPTPPTITTGSASGIGPTSATLNGTFVRSNGAASQVWFEYGPTTAYGNSTGTTSFPETGVTDASIWATISGLSCGSVYHYRIVGANSAGTSYGADSAFNTSACAAAAPTATTSAATAIAATTAMLNGVVTSNGAATTVNFQYGLTTGYGSSTTAAQSPLAAYASGAAVSAAVTGLTCSSTYHYRVVATNGLGTGSGTDVSFNTAACLTQSITFGTPPVLAVGGSGTLTASASSGLVITFSSQTPTRCTVSGNLVTGVAAGICTVAANQAGNGTYSPAPQITQSFGVSGPPVAGLAVSPLSLPFGGQSLNTTSPAQAVSISNTGGSALTVNSVAVSSGFAVGHDCATLAAGTSCTANVTFTPTTEGAVSGALSIVTSAGPATVMLSGVGERSLVTHYYRSILRRAPDAGGKTYWEGIPPTMQSWGANPNETWYAMATFFYFSDEYKALGRDDNGFVTDLYRTFFNREPDAGGLTYWTTQLTNGTPREVLLVSFLFSTEFTGFTEAIFGNTAARKEVDMVMDFYRGLLARLPDQGGFVYWLTQIRAAQCAGAGSVYRVVDMISRQFTMSGEYLGRGRSNAQYVGDLYNAFLRRGGDPGGVQYWIDQLNTGARNRENERIQFRDSPEFSARINGVVAQGCLN